MKDEKNGKDSIEIIEPQYSVVHEKKTGASMSLLNMSVGEAKAYIDKKMELSDHIRNAAIKRTIKGDWDDMGGNPYCNDKGIARIIFCTGISYEPLWQTEKEAEDSRGKYYIIITKVRAWHAWFEEESNLGVASERDPFYAKKKDKATGKMIWKDRLEISKPNIMKKSVTNGLGICVRKMLALNGLSWDDPLLKGKKGASVTYGKGKESQSQTENGEKKEPADQTKKQALHDEILKNFEDNEEKYKMTVFEIANGFKGLTDVRKITTEKWLNGFIKTKEKHTLNEWYNKAMIRREGNKGDLPF
jgi:hypothetical protein